MLVQCLSPTFPHLPELQITEAPLVTKADLCCHEAIYDLLRDSNIDDMITMNASLSRLVEAELITQEEALQHSNDTSELEKIFRGVYQGTRAYYE